VSRKLINILFIIGSCLYIPGIVLMIWGYAMLLQSIGAQAHYSSIYSSSPNYSSTSYYPEGFGTFMGLLMGGGLMTSLGSIVVLVAEIGALIELGKAQEWVWFVLMIIFGWIVLLIYLIAGPKPKPAPQFVAYPYPYAAPGQPWPNYPPPVPGMMLPPGQPWPNYSPPVPGMMPPPAMSPPAQPWAEYPAPPAE
jgi:hypothetical protein